VPNIVDDLQPVDGFLNAMHIELNSGTANTPPTGCSIVILSELHFDKTRSIAFV
jgi:hypothetical protein